MKANRILIVACALSLALAAVFAVQAWSLKQPRRRLVTTRPSQNEFKILYWWDPMLGPSSISDKPGISAMGMKLVPVYATATANKNEIIVDPATVQNMGLQTAKVTRGPLNVSVRAVGVLDMREPSFHDISLKQNGWVEKLYANTLGMPVHRGQVLFDFYSPALEEAQQELLMAVRGLKALPKNAEPATRQQAETLLASTKQRLELWDIAPQDIQAIIKAKHLFSTLPIRSPVDGELMDKNVVEGSAVTIGTNLMRIEDHSQLWLDAQIYPDQIPLVHVGQTMEATIAGLPGRQLSEQISFIYPHLDATGRTELVRAEVDNSDMTLKPGMYATVRIVTQPVKDAVLVPRDSVIDTGTEQIVFLAELGGHFKSRHVQVGLAGDGDKLQILHGLSPGETVVTSGQFLLDVESNTREAIAKMR